MGNDRMAKPINSKVQVIAASSSTSASSTSSGSAAAAAGGDSPAVAARLLFTNGADEGCDKALVKSLLSYKSEVPAYQANSSPTGELFPCQGCEDVFSLRTSLVDHLQRKTALIRMPCPGCQTKRYFYNKCLAFRHVRSHHADATVQKLEAIVGLSTVMPLPSNNSMPRSVAEELQQLESSVDALATVGSSSKITNVAAAATATPTSTAEVPAAAAAAVQPAARTILPNLVPAAPRAVLQPTLPAGSNVAAAPAAAAATAAAAAATVAAAATAPVSQMRLFSCTECCLPFEDQSSLHSHFGKPQRGVALTLRHICSVSWCGKAMFSACALSAHSRIHSRTRPFVCPECACVIPGEYEVFQKHVMFKCHHRSRVLEYSCAVCSEAFETLQQLQQHWSSRPQHCLMAHYDQLLKCSNCPLAFKSEELFAEHTLDADRPPCKKATAVFVFVCRVCDSVFRSLNELTLHNGAEHKVDLNQKRPATACYVYRCELCHSASASRIGTPRFRTIQTYDAHLRQEHDLAVITEMCDLCGVEFQSPEQLANHLVAVHSNGNGVIMCTKNPLGPMRTSTPTGGQRSVSEPAVRGTASSSALASADRRQQQQPQPPPSLLPSSSGVAASAAAAGAPDRSGSSVNGGKRKLPFACHLCGQRFAVYVELKEHSVNSHHGVGQLLECWICCEKSASHKSFNSSALLDRHLADVHQIDVGRLRPPSSAAAAGDDEMGGDDDGPVDVVNVGSEESARSTTEEREAEPPAKKLSLANGCGAGPAVAAAAADTERQCSRCGFRSRLRVEFVLHIRKHKVDAEQCLECGMCFPVEMALRRHLFVVHRVQDMAAYIREHGPLPAVDAAVAAPSPAPRSSGGGGSGVVAALPLADSNGRCLVCSRRFDSETAFRNHARSHGMAFISAKRAQSSGGIKSGSEDDSNDQASSTGTPSRV